MTHTAIYVRVSTDEQSTASQEGDLQRWADAQEGEVKWYTDHFTGTKMDRPGWLELEENLRRGLVNRIVVWRLDRLGRLAAALHALFDELSTLGVPLVSLRDGLDLSTPAGRMLAGVMASLAQFEREVIRERQAAGIEAKRDPVTGKCWWGGGVKGRRRKKLRGKPIQQMKRRYEAGQPISEIARLADCARKTVYRIAADEGWQRPSKE